MPCALLPILCHLVGPKLASSSVFSIWGPGSSYTTYSPPPPPRPHQSGKKPARRRAREDTRDGEGVSRECPGQRGCGATACQTLGTRVPKEGRKERKDERRVMRRNRRTSHPYCSLLTQQLGEPGGHRKRFCHYSDSPVCFGNARSSHFLATQ